MILSFPPPDPNCLNCDGIGWVHFYDDPLDSVPVYEEMCHCVWKQIEEACFAQDLHKPEVSAERPGP